MASSRLTDMSGPSSPQSSSPLAGAAEDEELLRLSPRAVLERRATCFAGLFAADFRAAVAAQERKLAAGCGPYGTRLAAVRLTDLTLGDPDDRLAAQCVWEGHRSSNGAQMATLAFVVEGAAFA